MFKISYDKKITLVQGDTGVIRMRIHNYELSQGDEVRFAIVNKVNPSILLCQHSDKKIVLEKQVTVFEKDGSARILIQPYDTEYLQPGKYLYEIQVKTKDGRVDTVVPLTSFTLMDGSIQGEYGQTTPSKPEPTPSEIELRFVRLEKEIIPELGTRITNVENEIDEKLNNQPFLNSNNYANNNNIYELDKLKLLDTTWAYYDSGQYPQFYPSCGMNENGEIYFQGLAKLDDSAGQSLDRGMVRFAKLFHFSIERFECVPMWGIFVGINDEDENDTTIIPFQIRPNGDILIKNIGKGSKYYKRIDLNGAKVQTSGFGKEKILKHIRSVENTVLNRPAIDATLLYFTDIHHNLYGGYNYRRYEQYKYINLVNRELDIICNISGGDNIEEYETRVKAINTMRDFLTQFEKNKLVYCNGNHDHNTMNGDNIFLHPDNVKPYINNSKTIYGGRYKYYGYTDYTDRKLRVIQLDTHEAAFTDNSISVGRVSDEQINWIKNNALINCPSDYIIIAVSHVAPTNQVYEGDTVLSNAYTIRTLFENFKNGVGEFAKQGRRDLCCWLSGHEHKDKIVTINGITYVNSLLTSSKEVQYIPQNDGTYTHFSREFGTEYELCFDIISINRTNRKVYFDRVGRVGNVIGRTREVSF